MSYFILMGRRIPKQAITGFKFQNETDNIRPFLSIRIRGKDEIIPFNKTVEEANNIRSRVLKYVDKIKRERAYNIDLCMTFERYVEIADKDAERAMAFLKEAYPFNEETEVFIRKRYNMSIAVDPEEN